MVVILGAGIVGAATAYYLSTDCSTTADFPPPITILDACPGPAGGSSGGAGAFLTNSPPIKTRGGGAKNSDKKRQALFEQSFNLHRKLATELELQSWCEVQKYQHLETCTTTTTTTTTNSCVNVNPPSWLAEGNIHATSLQGDAALVDPYELTSTLLNKAIAANPNAIFRQATVVGLETDDGNCCITGIRLQQDEHNNNSNNDSSSNEASLLMTIDPDEPVVIALGPWSCRIEDWLGQCMPIEGVLSTSMIFNMGIPQSDIGTALFCDEDDTNGCHLELLGRHDQSLYVSGCGESQVIGTQELRSQQRPSPAEKCSPNMASAAAAQSSLRGMGYNCHSSQLHQQDEQPAPDVVQACIRPTSPDGLPVIGKLLDNCYVATGGGPWGMTWGPLMGQCLASIINENGDGDGDAPVRLGPLKPQRFDTLIYRTLLKSRASPDVKQS
ncbi:MAG: hypothetical protein SGILL_004102 [Bacillariaceae sp.]